MPDIGARVHELRALENLASGRTVVHRLHPLSKLVSTLVFIVTVVSFGRYDFLRLVPYFFYPFIVMALSESPYKLMLPRVLIALPFCLFAGVSNAIFDRAAAFSLGGVAISFGIVSLAAILLKMYLCVMAALLLVATTGFTELTAQLRRIHVPSFFVMVFEMTYRYIGVLLEEVRSMQIAYRLRSGTRKSLDIRHMGPFLGQLLLRGFDRAERVHAAMSCRGYTLKNIPPAKRRMKATDVLAIAMVCIPSIVLRVVL